MRAYEAVMRQAADRAIDSWPVGEPFALLPSTQALTLDVIASTVFGVEEGPRQEDLKRRIRAMIEPVSNRWSLLLFLLSRGRFGGAADGRFDERRRTVDELLYEEIDRRRAVPDLE